MAAETFANGGTLRLPPRIIGEGASYYEFRTDTLSKPDKSMNMDGYPHAFFNPDETLGPVESAAPSLNSYPYLDRRTLPHNIPAMTSTERHAIKHDAGKADWALIPWDSVEEIVKVLEFGKTKYSAWNWSTGEGFTYTRVFNSSMRHLLAWIRGQDNDPETGLSHISHLGCNVLFLMHFIKHKDKYTTNDDRPNV